jgi:hypothetical protein
MRTTKVKQVAVALALLAMVCADAAAWGPRAKRALVNTAIQLIGRKYYDAFGTTDERLQQDVYRGAEAGWAAIAPETPLRTKRQAVDRVGFEVELLREVRSLGVGSYFAYRMGALGSLVADIVTPYGIPVTAQDAAIKRAMDEATEPRVEDWDFDLTPTFSWRLVTSPEEFFRRATPFGKESRRLIAIDYEEGDIYEGYLRRGGEAYFGRSVEAIANVWHTVLTQERLGALSAPSNDTLVEYLVSEIEYLLLIDDNVAEAKDTYQTLATYNDDDGAAFARVGDAFYEAGLEERGVEEWDKSLGYPNPNRSEVIGSLTEHFVEEGKRYFNAAQSGEPAEIDENLDMALYSFRRALEYDQDNSEAAELQGIAVAAKEEREEKRQQVITFISKANEIRAHASNSRDNRLWGDALTSYHNALQLLSEPQIEQFPEQLEHAQEVQSDIEDAIIEVHEDVLDAANEAIAAGDEALAQQRFQQAREEYASVPVIVEPLPEGMEEKTELIEQAQKKLRDVDRQEQRAQAQAQGQGGQGGGPGGPGGGPGQPGGPGGNNPFGP